METIQAVALNVSDIFYIVLIIFTTIIWTMLIIAIKRLLTVLAVAEELANYYYTVKKMLGYYDEIMENYKDKIKNLLK